MMITLFQTYYSLVWQQREGTMRTVYLSMLRMGWTLVMVMAVVAALIHTSIAHNIPHSKSIQ